MSELLNEPVPADLVKRVYEQALAAVNELVDVAELNAGTLLVAGASTSEIAGRRIGTAGSMDLGRAVARALWEIRQRRGVPVAVQGCEHINRALVVERAVAEGFGLEPVWVVPVPEAGGAVASAAYRLWERPVCVEAVRAHAGIDIGDTLIGMHLRPVAVPVRLRADRVGAARVVAARTRPKYVGGPRARYTPEDEG